MSIIPRQVGCGVWILDFVGRYKWMTPSWTEKRPMHPVISELHGKKRDIVICSNRGCFSLTLLYKPKKWNLRIQFADRCSLRSQNIWWYLFFIFKFIVFVEFILKITELWPRFPPIKSRKKLYLHDTQELILFVSLYTFCYLSFRVYGIWNI